MDSLDDELRASVLRRQQEGDLLGQVEDLMKETSAIMGDAASTEGERDGDTATSAAASSPAAMDMRRMMDALAKKDADLELAARIGDALFQENVRLRKETQQDSSTAMELASAQEQLQDAQEQLLAARDEAAALQRRVDILTSHLAEAEETQARQAEQLLNMDKERRVATPDSATAAADSPSPSPTRTGSQRAPHSSPAIARAVAAEASDREEEARRALDLAQASLAAWKKRAVAAERALAAQEQAREEEAIQRRGEELAAQQQVQRLQAKVDEASEAMVADREWDRERKEMAQEIAELRQAMQSLAADNDALREDLDEHKRLLEEGRAAAAQRHEDAPVAAASAASDSLAAELEAELGPSHGLPTPADQPSKRQQQEDKQVQADQQEPTTPRDDVDPYFFHFHMTAMSVKAHLSLRRAGNKSSRALDTINAMDTKEMYEEVLAKAIPPHHWIGYIQDCFSRAQIKALLHENSSGGGGGHGGGGGGGGRNGTSANHAASRTVDVVRPAASRKPSHGGYFSRLLFNFGASPPSPPASPRRPQPRAAADGAIIV